MRGILRDRAMYRRCLLLLCTMCVAAFVLLFALLCTPSSTGDRSVELEMSIKRRRLLDPLTKWLSDADASRHQKVPLSHWVQEATIAASDMLNASIKSTTYEYSKQLRHKPTNLNESLLTIANEVGTELEKSFVMNEALKDYEYRSALTLNRPDVACLTKKRIVVDVNRCGLGNRILAVFSSIMLAVLTNRVLEIVWEANKYCGSSYEELFSPKEQVFYAKFFFFTIIIFVITIIISSMFLISVFKSFNDPFVLFLPLSLTLIPSWRFKLLMIRQDQWVMKPLVYNNSKLAYDNVRSEFSCHIRLDQSEWEHFYFLLDRELFDRMNMNCDVIFMVTNQLFHELLLDHTLFGNDADRLRVTFPYPFSNVSQIAFRPKASIALQAEMFYRQYLQVTTTSSIFTVTLLSHPLMSFLTNDIFKYLTQKYNMYVCIYTYIYVYIYIYIY